MNQFSIADFRLILFVIARLLGSRGDPGEYQTFPAVPWIAAVGRAFFAMT